MKPNTYCYVSAVLFTLVAIAHLARFVYGWSVQIDDTSIPMVVSLFGFVIPGVLAFFGF